MTGKLLTNVPSSVSFSIDESDSQSSIKCGRIFQPDTEVEHSWLELAPTCYL